jgi:hypothetical protein
MADTKISALPSGAPALATDETVIARAGANYKLTVANITGYLGSPITVANGGTGQSSYTDGQLLIGNSTGNTLSKATLTAGSGITITNGSGSITIAATGGGSGTVTSVGGTGTVNGITLTGTVTTSGSLTLGGTLSGVSLTTQVSGTLPVVSGGTGQTSYTDGQLLIGNSTGNTLTKATLTAGSGISITNGSGAITIAATGGGGTVTSVSGTGTVSGLTLTGTVTTSGNLTLGGTLSVNLATSVTGTLPVANGGTVINSFGTGVATWLGTPSSANLASAVTDETGSGALVFANTPTLVTPILGTPTSGNLSNCTADGTNAVGFRKVPQSGSDKTTSYSLVTSDVGKFVGVGTGGSITIPDATFASGDIVSVFNNTSGNITITCTITTAYIAGTDADKATVTLATRGVATILFISGTVCVISGNVS